jgi:hypothetical protein
MGWIYLRAAQQRALWPCFTWCQKKENWAKSSRPAWACWAKMLGHARATCVDSQREQSRCSGRRWRAPAWKRRCYTMGERKRRGRGISPVHDARPPANEETVAWWLSSMWLCGGRRGGGARGGVGQQQWRACSSAPRPLVSGLATGGWSSSAPAR